MLVIIKLQILIIRNSYSTSEKCLWKTSFIWCSWIPLPSSSVVLHDWLYWNNPYKDPRAFGDVTNTYNFKQAVFQLFPCSRPMSGARRSSRIRKPITTIDQNLDDDDEDVFIPSKERASTQRLSNKRASTDDNGEQEMITPNKKQKKKASATTTTKTSPYFNTKSPEKKTASPVVEKKKTQKGKATKANAKEKKQSKVSVDENVAVSNRTTTKSQFIRCRIFHALNPSFSLSL